MTDSVKPESMAPEKIDGTSCDIADQRRRDLKQLFPGAFIETTGPDGQPLETIDFERLKAELGTFSDVYEGRRERYGMEWPGKRDCMKLIQEPSRATLKPCRDESVDFDTTQNLFIEGDNLEVLKLLQKSYYGKVKMIYIDPPYNTGKEFIYPDKYSESLETYLAYAGLIDSQGKQFSTNTPTEGRFHTKWLNMMYPRLYLARNLMRGDGVIFISIDDNEVENLRRICDEIFGSENFVSQLIWDSEGNTDNQLEIKVKHEYILAYCKDRHNIDEAIGYVIDPNTREDSNLHKGFADNNITKNNTANPPQVIELPIGFDCTEDSLSLDKERLDKEFFEITKKEKIISDSVKKRYSLSNLPVRLDPLEVRRGKLSKPCRMYSGYANAEKLRTYIAGGLNPLSEDDGEIRFYLNRNGCIRYRKDRDKARNILSVVRNVGTTERARSELKRLGIYFDYPKPVGLLKYLLSIGAEPKDSIVMDFFAGSATMAEACFERTVEGNPCRFIMVQLPEPMPEDSAAFKDGCETLSKLGRKRIVNAIEEIHGSGSNVALFQEKLGFATFTLDKSNFHDWDAMSGSGSVDDIAKQLDFHVTNTKEEARQEDILYELLLKSGFSLTDPIQRTEVFGKAVFSVANGALIICLEDELTADLIDAVANLEPMQFICLDKAFKGNDQLKANAVQTFKSRSEGAETEMVFKVV